MTRQNKIMLFGALLVLLFGVALSCGQKTTHVSTPIVAAQPVQSTEKQDEVDDAPEWVYDDSDDIYTGKRKQIAKVNNFDQEGEFHDSDLVVRNIGGNLEVFINTGDYAETDSEYSYASASRKIAIVAYNKADAIRDGKLTNTNCIRSEIRGSNAINNRGIFFDNPRAALKLIASGKDTLRMRIYLSSGISVEYIFNIKGFAPEKVKQ